MEEMTGRRSETRKAMEESSESGQVSRELNCRRIAEARKEGTSRWKV